MCYLVNSVDVINDTYMGRLIVLSDNFKLLAWPSRTLVMLLAYTAFAHGSVSIFKRWSLKYEYIIYTSLGCVHLKED